MTLIEIQIREGKTKEGADYKYAIKLYQGKRYGVFIQETVDIRRLTSGEYKKATGYVHGNVKC